MAAPYGGLATSPYPAQPSTIYTKGDVYNFGEGIRPRKGYQLRPYYVEAKGAETIRKGDILCVTSQLVERALNPAGTATTATLSGDGGSVPRYVAAETIATTATAAANVKILVYDIATVELKFRLYHATASSAVITGVTRAIDPGTTSGVYYEWGIAEVTATNNYFPIIDVANQDDTNGSFKVVELCAGEGVTDYFPAVWVQATGSA